MGFHPIIVGFVLVSFGAGCGDSSKSAADSADGLEVGDGDATDTAPQSEVATEVSPDTDASDSGPDTVEPDTADTAGPADTADTAEPADASDTSGEVTPSGLKHVLCHEPAGAAETTTVEEDDVAVHLDHGDLRGPCSPLAATLVPESHTMIDCGGRELTPADPAVDTFLFLHDVEDVHLVDCVARFDIGVFIVGGGENVIRDNELRTASIAVMILASDANRIEDNLVRYGSTGVDVDRDADDNVIERNDFAPSGDDLGVVWPGSTEQLPPDEAGGAAFYIRDYVWPPVSFAFINGELIQVPNLDTNTDGNVFRDNDVNGGLGLAVVVRAKDTLVENNRLRGTVFGVISPGYPDEFPIALPGKCSLAPDRWCGGDADCDLAGYDAAPNGVCEGTSSIASGGRIIGSRIQGNLIEGSLATGIWMMGTRDAVVRDNIITGGPIGIHIEWYSFQAITVTGNRVSDNEVGLVLLADGIYGATVTGNDFVGNLLGIRSTGVANVDGNYWGRDECPAFAIEDADGRGHDCAPYATSVAGGVPDDVAPCAVETRPRAFDGTCAFDAPPSVEVTSGSQAAFEVDIGYSGDYSVAGFGLTAEQTRAGTATAEQELLIETIDVPAGTRHLRLGLDGYADIAVFDPSCAVYDWSCPFIAYGGQWGPLEEIDLPAPDDPRYVVAVMRWQFDSEDADYVLSWWAVPDDNVDLTVSAPPEVVTGTSVTVDVSWPESLTAGRYLGVLAHANEHGPLRSTLLEVEVPGQ